MSNEYTLLTFKDICMNFLLELKFFILDHPVTFKQPLKIVQILLGHPVHIKLRLKCKFKNKLNPSVQCAYGIWINFIHRAKRPTALTA